MNIKYDETTDSMYFKLSPEKVYESEELEDDVIVDYNRDNKIVAIEILNFNKKHRDFNIPILGEFFLEKAS